MSALTSGGEFGQVTMQSHHHSLTVSAGPAIPRRLEGSPLSFSSVTVTSSIAPSSGIVPAPDAARNPAIKRPNGWVSNSSFVTTAETDPWPHAAGL